MKIEKVFNGVNVSFELTRSEMHELYLYYKKDMDIEETREYLDNYSSENILSICCFPFPSYRYLTEDSRNKAAEAICQNEKLMLDIFEVYEADDSSDSYEDQMAYAVKVGLMKFGKENPLFLKQFETIETIAYRQYQQEWYEEQSFSKEYLEKFKKDYEEYCEDSPNTTIEEFLDEVGFDGTLYVCFDEFLDNEYKDVIYMSEILTEDEYEEYLSKNFDYVWKDIVLLKGKYVCIEKFPISVQEEDPFHNRTKEYQVADFLGLVEEKYGLEGTKTYAIDHVLIDDDDISLKKYQCGCYKCGKLEPEFKEKNALLKKENDIYELKKLEEKLPFGVIYDSDSLLFDLLKSSSMNQFAGIATDVFTIWEQSNDKKSIENLFYELTGCEFDDFLTSSKNAIYSTLMAHQIGKWLHTLNSSASISISYLIDELKSSLHKYTEWSTQLKAEEKTQFFGDLINAIENTFSFYNVHIHSDERIEAIKNGENPEELSIIYGKLYDELADLLSNVLGITR